MGVKRGEVNSNFRPPHMEMCVVAGEPSAIIEECPARQKTFKKSSVAFTLIELLVVIGIIAILAALLLPALARAKARSYQINCNSNLKQLAYAIDMYTHDYQESFPGPAWQGIYFTYQDQNANWPSGNPYLDKYYGSLVGQLTSYLGYPPPDYQTRTAAVTICPASFRVLPKVQAFPPLKVPISYFTQSPVNNDPDLPIMYPFGRPDPSNPVLPKKTPDFRHPSDQWAITDCDFSSSPAWASLPPNTSPTFPKLPVHGSIKPAFAITCSSTVTWPRRKRRSERSLSLGAKVREQSKASRASDSFIIRNGSGIVSMRGRNAGKRHGYS